MGPGPKLMVFKLKEIIYTAVFVILAIILIFLLTNIFLGGSDDSKKDASAETGEYLPVNYITSEDL